jgi:hypothetical protein
MKFAIGFALAALLATAATFGQMVYAEMIGGYAVHIACVTFTALGFGLGSVHAVTT